MVLAKRKRNGEFVTWAPAGQEPAPSVAPEPPAKKSRTNTTDCYPPPDSSSSAWAVPTSSMKTAIPTAPHVSTSADTPTRFTDELPQPGPSQATKAARSRKKADADAPKPEKRGAIFKKSCPRNIIDRVERVMSQRFFMIDRQRNDEELGEVFSVLGSTGNVYTVTIDHSPSCNCPDAAKGNHCKHILFIFLKVLQVTQDSGVWYQKALLTSELEQIFREAPLAPNSVAHPRIREAHARATGKATVSTQSPLKKRIPGPDDDCPICYDGMNGVKENMLVFCENCGNAVHKQCFEEWSKNCTTSYKDLTCVWCRARWTTVSAAGSSRGIRSAEGYLNLSGVSGLSPVRDTSTYYHGPRRGQRYNGFQEYFD